MILIDLLPLKERRAHGSTRLALAASLVAAVVLLGLSGGAILAVELRLAGAERGLALAEARARRLEVEAQGTLALERLILQARRREDAIFAIAEQRVAWSLELQRWLPCFMPCIFINRMQLEPRLQSNGARVSVNCTAKGDDPSVVTIFRQRWLACLSERHDLRALGFDSPRITRVAAPPGVDVAHVLNFDVRVTLP